MHIHHLYAGPDGESHFRDVTIDWETEGPGGKFSACLPATGIIFRVAPEQYDYAWHTATQRQYLINLDAAVAISASDGETRVIGPGEVVLVEDTTGKGHCSRAVMGKMRHSVFITID